MAVRKSSSSQLQRLDAFFAAQSQGKRGERVLLLLAVIAGGLLWLPTVLASWPTTEQAPLPVFDPFAETSLLAAPSDDAPTDFQETSLTHSQRPGDRGHGCDTTR